MASAELAPTDDCESRPSGLPRGYDWSLVLHPPLEPAHTDAVSLHNRAHIHTVSLHDRADTDAVTPLKCVDAPVCHV
jgi:hypothetical protein